MWNDEKANSKIRSPKFRGRQILDNDTLAVATTPNSVNRKMAFAVGFSILEFSKLEMYKVKMRPENILVIFSINCKFTNTHSFLSTLKRHGMIRYIPNFQVLSFVHQTQIRSFSR